MTLALKWGDPKKTDEFSGFIYIDSVGSYTQEYRGQVSKHPIDTGASVSDHFISENPVYNITGVISSTDFSNIPYYIRDQENNRPFNAQQQPPPVSVQSTGGDLLQYLPDTIGQFLNLSSPTVEVFGDVRTGLSSEIASKDMIELLLLGLKYNPKTDRAESNIQTVQLYEYDGLNIRDIITDLVITGFRVREDAETGDGLFLDLTLEKVRFALVKKVVLSKDVSDSLKKKAATNSNKGNKSSQSKDVESAKEDKDPSAPTTSSSTLKQLGNGFGLGQALPQ